MKDGEPLGGNFSTRAVVSAVRVVAHGNRFYLSVRPRDMEFWGLTLGNEVLMKIVKVKRPTPTP